MQNFKNASIFIISWQYLGCWFCTCFQKALDKSKRKPNKTWVDKRSEFYNRPMKSWLQVNNIKIYSTHNEGKSVVVERFIRTLKNKIYKYMTSISKNVYIDKIKEIVNKYNNTYHNIIKMNPVAFKDYTYVEFGRESNKKIINFTLVIM